MMGGKNSKTKEEDRSVNNIAPVQTIRVDNEMGDLSFHDTVLYILVVLLTAVIIVFGAYMWCRKNKKKTGALRKASNGTSTSSGGGYSVEKMCCTQVKSNHRENSG